MNRACVDKIELIKDKKIINAEDKTEIDFETLWTDMMPDGLVFIMFFRNWGWMFCKAGAMDLCRTYDKINEEFPNKMKLIGVGLEFRGYEEFKEGKYFSHEVFIDKNKGIYKALKFKKPGCLSCFGFCNRGVSENKNKIEKKYKDKKFGVSVDLKKDLFQMGGSLLLTQKGQTLLEHVDAFYGDHAKEEDIIEIFRSYYEEKK